MRGLRFLRPQIKIELTSPPGIPDMSASVKPRRNAFSKLFRPDTPAGPKLYDFPDQDKTSVPSPYPFQVNHDNLLAELGAKYQPSKRHHNYLVYYWKHFRDIRLQVTRVLEIGVQTERCLKMWEEFFPNATILGADIDPACKAFEGGRRKVMIGDQGDVEFCHQLVDAADGAFDIIIDDGSHLAEHQMKSFNWLFPKLTEHGIYVIEDTGGVVGDTELKTINSLRKLVDNIMYWPEGYRPEDWGYLSEFDESASWADHNIIGASFYRWIAFIMRGNNPGDNAFLHKGPPPSQTPNK